MTPLQSKLSSVVELWRQTGQHYNADRSFYINEFTQRFVFHLPEASVKTGGSWISDGSRILQVNIYRTTELDQLMVTLDKILKEESDGRNLHPSKT